MHTLIFPFLVGLITALVIKALDIATANKKDKEIEELKTLVDAAYVIVELHKVESPYNIKWKKEWLANAKKHGASSY